jgi:hypothetical protein
MAVACRAFDPLVKNDRCWKVSVEDRGASGVFIVRSYGQIGKKQCASANLVDLKDGSASAWDQACIEAQGLWQGCVDRGYDSADGAGNPPRMLPMLAMEFEKHGQKLPAEVYFQPKLDGIRLLVGNVGAGELRSTSRSGKPLSVPHVVRALEGCLEPGEYLDGEIFKDGVPFERIAGAVRKDSPLAKVELVYHVFDTFKIGHDEPFEDRHARLQQKLAGLRAPCLQLVETTSGAKEGAQRMLESYVAQGQEGVIIWDPKMPYKLDKRCVGLQKLKTFQSREYRIVGAEQGTGREFGAVIWVCATEPGGLLFRARPLGSIEERRQMYVDRESHKGKLLTVKFQELTLLGIPRFPVGLSIRDYE